MQLLFPNASPVTVATWASSSKNNAKSLEFFIILFLIFFPKKDDISGKT